MEKPDRFWWIWRGRDCGANSKIRNRAFQNPTGSDHSSSAVDPMMRLPLTGRAYPIY